MTPESSPVPAPAHTGPLKEGDWVQVTGTDSCLNVRIQPSLAPAFPGAGADSAVTNCLPDGFIARLGYGVTLSAQQMPVQADGHWWWYLLGQGWAAEDWLAFHHEGEMPYPIRPELSGEQIVYIGLDQGIWLMNADGSGQRSIFPRRSVNENFSQLQWSPSGTLVSFTYRDYTTGPVVGTLIVDYATGQVFAELPGFVEALWSPDGARLSGIRFEAEGGLGGYTGAPVVLTLANGTEVRLGPSHSMMNAPAWSPDGQQLALTCLSYVFGEAQPDGSVKETRIDCGGDGLRIATADGINARVLVSFTNESSQIYGNPSWSPDGRTIALYTRPPSESGGCRGYQTVNVATGALSGCISLPQNGGSGYQCGGSAEDGASDWSPDGQYLAYHSSFGAGTNGVYMRNLAAGGTHVIPSSRASSASFSASGNHLTFEGSGYVWVADSDGSGLAILVGGSNPAWQPR